MLFPLERQGKKKKKLKKSIKLSCGKALFQSYLNSKVTDAHVRWCHEVQRPAIPSRKSAVRWEAGEQYQHQVLAAEGRGPLAGKLWSVAHCQPGPEISESAAGWGLFSAFSALRTAAQAEDCLQNIPAPSPPLCPSLRFSLHPHQNLSNIELHLHVCFLEIMDLHT